MPEIEFVDPDPEPGEDEELSNGPRRRRSGRSARAVRVGTAVVVGAAIVGAVLLGVLGKGVLGEGGGGAPAGKSDGPSASVTAVAPDDVPPSLVVVAACPVVDACRTDVGVPPPVAAALDARLSGVTDISATTTVVKGRTPTLRSRHVEANAGRITVHIDIEPTTRGDTSHVTSATVGPSNTTSAVVVAHGLTVDVTASGPDWRSPGAAVIRAIAADRRLLAVG